MNDDYDGVGGVGGDSSNISGSDTYDQRDTPQHS